MQLKYSVIEALENLISIVEKNTIDPYSNIVKMTFLILLGYHLNCSQCFKLKRSMACMDTYHSTYTHFGHSWCMASGNGCGGRGLYDSTLCTSCGEGVIDPSHRQFWEAVRDQQLNLLANFGDDLGEPVRARCQRHLEKAEMVLKELQIKEVG